MCTWRGINVTIKHLRLRTGLKKCAGYDSQARRFIGNMKHIKAVVYIFYKTPASKRKPLLHINSISAKYKLGVPLIRSCTINTSSCNMPIHFVSDL